MEDISNKELALALLRSLEHLDAWPKGFNYDDERSVADRDLGRKIGLHILKLVPDMGELARMCIDLWAETVPSILNDHCTYYRGPDVYRTFELDRRYPDGSGRDPDDDESDYTTWMERCGRKAEEDAFYDKATLRFREAKDQFKARKADAAREKRQARKREQHQQRVEETRRQHTINAMLRSATAPSSDARH